MPILNKHLYQVRVSSVLNRDIQNCGKQCMFDNVEETCWCSDQGSPQWISFAFHQPVRLDSLQVQFQGGFVGKECQVIMSNANGEDKTVEFYPEDINTVQTFNLYSYKCEKVKIIFSTSTDFFGRVVIYKLDFCGEKI